MNERETSSKFVEEDPRYKLITDETMNKIRKIDFGIVPIHHHIVEGLRIFNRTEEFGQQVLKIHETPDSLIEVLLANLREKISKLSKWQK